MPDHRVPAPAFGASHRLADVDHALVRKEALVQPVRRDKLGSPAEHARCVDRVAAEQLLETDGVAGAEDDASVGHSGTFAEHR